MKIFNWTKTKANGLDFKELPVNGQAFEQLVRELLFSRGLHVHWSGNGPDGGRDLICYETLSGLFGSQTKTWLVQCKHNAHSRRSVSKTRVDNIVDSCTEHGASGYLIVCSTQPSSSLVSRLEAITNSTSNNIDATYWDAVTLERMLSNCGQWAIAQRFMPKSCGDWKIYATEAPNGFVAHYKGYVFHLTNRIGSGADHHLGSVRDRIGELEAIDLPEDHFIRPRGVWWNAKGAEYMWYIDYMYPTNESPSLTAIELKQILKDGWFLDDGKLNVWDICYVQYNSMSDHYDKDHYSYYTKYMPNFLSGRTRGEPEWRQYYATKQDVEKLKAKADSGKHESWLILTNALENLDFLEIWGAVNASPECIGKMEGKFNWTDVVKSLEAEPQHIFSAKLILKVTNDEKFHSLVNTLPQANIGIFRLARVHVYTIDGISSRPEEYIYDLEITVFPNFLCNEFEAREAFNNYFELMTKSVNDFTLQTNS